MSLRVLRAARETIHLCRLEPGLCWQGRRWGVWAASLLAVATALVAAAFGLHVMGGGAYEMRTVGALAFRLLFLGWL